MGKKKAKPVVVIDEFFIDKILKNPEYLKKIAKTGAIVKLENPALMKALPVNLQKKISTLTDIGGYTKRTQWKANIKGVKKQKKRKGRHGR